MMMSLGMFVFGLPTFAYQDLKRRCDFRHATSGRVGARAATQFLGVGDETVDLSGCLLPDVAGDPGSFETIRDMGKTGEGYPLVDGAGQQLGVFVITSADESQENFLEDGVPRKYDFRLSLLRIDDEGDQAGGSTGRAAASTGP